MFSISKPFVHHQALSKHSFPQLTSIARSTPATLITCAIKPPNHPDLQLPHTCFAIKDGQYKSYRHRGSTLPTLRNPHNPIHNFKFALAGRRIQTPQQKAREEGFSESVWRCGQLWQFVVWSQVCSKRFEGRCCVGFAFSFFSYCASLLVALLTPKLRCSILGRSQKKF